MWPPHMHTESVTQLSISHGMQNSQVVESVAEFMFALQHLCASHSCALSISTQMNADGQVELIGHTLLTDDVVAALLVSVPLPIRGCIVRVSTVQPQILMGTNAAFLQRRNLRVSHGL